ncbi:MAG: methyltransferase domain-containing protein [Planctomycetes bacterium]|nr:methyltransferase domain-containing protein [Planctomycetota bacterium]
MKPLDRLREIGSAYQPLAALAAAAEVGLLDRLRRGAADVPALVRSCRASARGIRVLADALVGLRFLQRRGPRYAFSPEWRPLFEVQDGAFARSLLLSAARSMRALLDLPRAVRRGGTRRDLDDPAKAAAFFRDLVPALHESNRAPARRAAAALGLPGLRRPFRVLDVAAGSGVWGIAAAQASPHVRVDALDLPPVLRVTRGMARREGVAPRFRFLPGDLRRFRIDRRRYDVVILGHICHSEGAARTRRLLRAARRALAPGGRILIAEYLADEDRKGPLASLLFALVMLARTEEGKVFTSGEMRRLLREAGFAEPRRIHAPPNATLLLARVAP